MKRLLASLLKISKIPKEQMDALFWRIIVGTYSMESNRESEKVEKGPEEMPLLAEQKEKGDSIAKSSFAKDDMKCKPIQPENYKFMENLTNYITKGNK